MWIVQQIQYGSFTSNQKQLLSSYCSAVCFAISDRKSVTIDLDEQADVLSDLNFLLEAIDIDIVIAQAFILVNLTAHASCHKRNMGQLFPLQQAAYRCDEMNCRFDAIQRGFSVSCRYGKCSQHHRQSSFIPAAGWSVDMGKSSLKILHVSL